MNSIALALAATYSVLLPLVVGLYHLRRLPEPGRWLVGLLFTWLLVELGFNLISIIAIENISISYILSLLELFFVWRIFAPLLPEAPVKWLALVGVPITIIEYFYGNVLNSVSLIYECALIVALGLLLFREMAEGRVHWNYAWTASGLMILFAGSSVYYSAFLHPDDASMLRMLAFFHTLLLFLVYGILTIAVWRLSLITKPK